MENKSGDINLDRKIDAYIKGTLSDEETRQLWVQLMKKPEYISQLQTEIDLAKMYKSSAKPAQTATIYWKWIGAAAAVLLLVVSLNVFTNNQPKPIQQWSEKSVALADNLSSAEVTRSSANTLEPADSLLNLGFKTAVSGQTDQAMDIFRRIIAEYENSAAASKAHLNLGILKYNSGDFKGSIENFNRAIALGGDDSLLVERSYWYMGNALVNTNQLEQARDAVEQTFSMGDIYKHEAFKMLKRLDYELGYIDFDNFEQQMDETK